MHRQTKKVCCRVLLALFNETCPIVIGQIVNEIQNFKNSVQCFPLVGVTYMNTYNSYGTNKGEKRKLLPAVGFPFPSVLVPFDLHGKLFNVTPFFTLYGGNFEH